MNYVSHMSDKEMEQYLTTVDSVGGRVFRDVRERFRYLVDAVEEYEEDEGKQAVELDELADEKAKIEDELEDARDKIAELNETIDDLRTEIDELKEPLA